MPCQRLSPCCQSGIFLFAVLFIFVLPQAAFAGFTTLSLNGGPTGQEAPIDAYVDRQFSSPLSSATVTTTNVLLRANGGNTEGGTASGTNLCTSVRLEGVDRVLCEHAPLIGTKWYTFTLGTGIQSTGTGMALSSSGNYAFRTSSFQGGAGFFRPPFIDGSAPRAGTKFPINATIGVFIEPGGSNSGSTMKTTGTTGSVLSTNNVKLFLGDGKGQPSGSNLLKCNAVGADPALPTDCNMAWDDTKNLLMIQPGKKAPTGAASTGGTALLASKEYVLVVEGMGKFGGFNQQSGRGVQNADGASVSEDLYVVFTSTGSDALGPDMKGSYPKHNDTSVDRAIYDISVSFTETLNPLSATGGSTGKTDGIKLYCEDDDGIASNGCTNTNDAWDANDAAVPAFWEFDDDSNDFLLSPSALLAASTEYYVRVSTNIEDLAGNQFDGDRTAAGNQAEVIKFTTGTNINGGASDTTKPQISFVRADNFMVAITFTEPMKYDIANNESEKSASGHNLVNNINNWSIESPIGVKANLSNKSIEYIPSILTLEITGFTFAPGQQVRIKSQTATGAVKMEDLSANTMSTTGSGGIVDVTVEDVNSTFGSLRPGEFAGEFNFHDFGTRPTMVFPRSMLAGVTTTYEAEFPVTAALASGSTFVLSFPKGFSFIADSGTEECKDIINAPDNKDLNGPRPGKAGVALIACDSVARSVTLTMSGSLAAGEGVRFRLQGITNSPVAKDFTTGGYTVGIKTKNPQGVQQESLNAFPFFLSQPGTQSISGVVFNDSGNGGGTANNGTKDGTESGVADIEVCLGGFNGFQCQTSTSTGAYKFIQLSAGFFNLVLPPLTAGNFIGGPFFRDIQLIGTNNATANFALRSADRFINVNVKNIPALTDLDIATFNPFSMDAGGQIVRPLLFSSTSAGSGTVQLPVTNGTWEVVVLPWQPKDQELGRSAPPEFKFMPPQPVQTTVSGANVSISFTLRGADAKIKGKVIEGSGSGIPNVFVNARPTESITAIGGGGFAQSQNDGSFTLNVSTGVYVVQSFMPGMPSSKELTVTVINNVSNADNNTSSDVYVNGVLIINDGDADSDDLLLKVDKGGRSIAGRVLDESGNAIQYAHVMAEEVDSSGNPIGPFADTPTDSSGNFTIYVDDGTWELFAFAPGYGELPSISVTVAGSNLSGQNLQADSSDFGTLTGSVKKGGTGVAGAFVHAFGSSGANGGITDESGTFTLKLPAGTYELEGFLPGGGETNELSSITITAGVTTGNQNLTLASPGTIKVTIAGVTDAFVHAQDSNARGNGTNSNTTAGVYELKVGSGMYTVEAHSPAYGKLGSKSSVSVTGGSTAEVTFSAPTTYQVSGTVASSSSTCTNQPSVFLSNSTDGRSTVITASSSGLYTVSLPEGGYLLSAAKPGCIDAATPTKINISTSNLTGQNRTLSAADSTIVGRVTLSGTGVTQETTVIAQSSDGNYVFAEVDTTKGGGGNNYSLSVTAGTWTVSARSNGSSSSSTSVTVSSGGSGSADLTLSAISGYTRKERKTSTVTPSQGGIVKNTNIGSNFTVTVPAGALGSSSDSASVQTQETTAIATQTPTANVIGGKGFEIIPKDADGNKITPSSAITFTIPYSDTDVTTAGVSEDKLVIVHWDSSKGQWEPLSTTVDTTNNTLTASTTSFSTFAPSAPTGGGAPSTPSGLTAVAASSTAIKLTWTAVSNITGYDIYHSSAIDGTFQRIGNEPTISDTSATTYTDEGLGAGVTYYYKISAINSSGESAASAAVSATPTGSAGSSGGASGGGGGRSSGGGGGGGGGGTSLKPAASESVDTERTVVSVSRPTGKTVTVALESVRGMLQIPIEGKAVLFHDIPVKEWFAEYVAAVIQAGIASGYRDESGRLKGEYGPGNPVLYGEIIKMAIEASGRNVMHASTTTKNRSARDHWSARYVRIAEEIDVSVFKRNPNVDSPATRGAVVQTVLETLGVNIEKGLENPYKDVGKSHKFGDAILTATKLGIVAGDTKRDGSLAGTFRPNAPVNRAETAKIFARLMDLGLMAQKE